MKNLLDLNLGFILNDDEQRNENKNNANKLINLIKQR